MATPNNNDAPPDLIPLPGVFVKQAIMLQAWAPSLLHAGYDKDGAAVRTLVASTPDGAMEVHLGGLTVEVCQKLAAALLEELPTQAGLLVPTAQRTQAGIVLPT
jgi:hypothetical protein